MSTAKELIEFEEDIAKEYEAGKIKAPVHLRNGNEQQLVDIFNQLQISNEDYIYSTWASHLHALLKGIPSDKVRNDILEGRSITLHYPEHNFFSSAIVGGISPIAVGTALALKMSEKNSRVYCFLGDMAFRTGISHESIIYSISNDLPITFVVEDNGKSVGTPTEECWGKIPTKTMFEVYDNLSSQTKTSILYYKYEMSYPHSGTGVFVEF
jgi:TPP-dependent pyruvate/acetoin dehydrogenase alpha subunit|uniref:Transketolase central region-containing protein n=1 Tax=uncultured marine virus TaxID=186617 RepID=A0A0F7LBI3_9VIRU|nr:transketolase central region-containing protein [uncultured marine virus]